MQSGDTPLLIATDVAARGLDIDDVEVVINYSFPLVRTTLGEHSPGWQPLFKHAMSCGMVRMLLVISDDFSVQLSESVHSQACPVPLCQMALQLVERSPLQMAADNGGLRSPNRTHRAGRQNR